MYCDINLLYTINELPVVGCTIECTELAPNPSVRVSIYVLYYAIDMNGGLNLLSHSTLWEKMYIAVVRCQCGEGIHSKTQPWGNIDTEKLPEEVASLFISTTYVLVSDLPR